MKLKIRAFCSEPAKWKRGASSLLDLATFISPASSSAGSSGELPKFDIPIGHDEVMNKSTGADFDACPFHSVLDYN